MRLDRLLFGSIAAIFTVHAAATALSWYFIYDWLDIPMHMAGGFWVGLLFAYLFLERHKTLPAGTPPAVIVILGLGFVALIGAVWEFYEYFSYTFILRTLPFGGSVDGVHFDTLKDLFNDLFGGFVAISVYLALRKKS